jgi:hypothetical protein
VYPGTSCVSAVELSSPVPATPAVAPVSPLRAAGAPEAVATVAEVTSIVLETPTREPVADPSAVDSEGPLSTGKTQKNRGRCFQCKKKVGLTGFECRCSKVFCGQVRLCHQVFLLFRLLVWASIGCADGNEVLTLCPLCSTDTPTHTRVTSITRR